MTEQVWLECTEPKKMLEFLQSLKTSERKLRLFTCACCRRIWLFLPDSLSRKKVDFGEQYADGYVSDKQRLSISKKHCKLAMLTPTQMYADSAASWVIASPLTCVQADHCAVNAQNTIWSNDLTTGQVEINQVDVNVEEHGWPEAISIGVAPLSQTEKEYQSNCLRDLIGNPFRSITINPAWLTPTVRALAQSAYDERNLPSGTLDNTRLAILADCLEDSGCENPDILNHLRQPGTHVRGCWVVDLLLGKA